MGTRKKTFAETNTTWLACAIEVLVLLQTASMRQYLKTRVSVLVGMCCEVTSLTKIFRQVKPTHENCWTGTHACYVVGKNRTGCELLSGPRASFQNLAPLVRVTECSSVCQLNTACRPKFLVHKNKQRLTKLVQFLIRSRRLSKHVKYVFEFS